MYNESTACKGRASTVHACLGYKRETSSATIAAAGCGCLARATLCPAHSEIASISPLVPAMGAAGSYRRISSPEANCAMTSSCSARLRLTRWGPEYSQGT